MTYKVRWFNAVRPLRISRSQQNICQRVIFFISLVLVTNFWSSTVWRKNILEQTTLRFSKIILDQVSQRVLQGVVVSTDKFLISFATKQHFSEQDFFVLKILWWRNCEMDCELRSVAIKYMETAKQLLQLYIRIAKKNDALPYTKQHVNLRTWFLMLNIWKVWSVTFLVWKGNIKMTTYLCSIRWRHVTPGRQFWYLKPFSVFQAISSPSPFVWSALTIVSVDVGYKVPFDPNWTNQNLFEQKYRITNEETGHQPPLQLKLSLVHRNLHY